MSVHSFTDDTAAVAGQFNDNFAASIMEWCTTLSYSTGQVVRKAGTYEIYGSIGNSNLNNALPTQVSDANWTYLGILGKMRDPGITSYFSGPLVNLPTGWLNKDGSAISRTTYKDLFNALTVAKGTFTVTQATPAIFTLNSHGFVGLECVELTTTGALYTGLTANTNYWVIYINANTFYLATSLANAIAGTKIATSGSQSGVHSLRYCPHGISGASNFLLPDTRSATLRGVGTPSLYTDSTVTLLAQIFDDTIQNHAHNIYGDGSSGGNSSVKTNLAGVSQGRSDLVYSVIGGGSYGARVSNQETTGKARGEYCIISY